MQISKVNNNLYTNVSFKASYNVNNLMPDKNKISYNAAKKIRELNMCIDKIWSDIKKGENVQSSPKFQLGYDKKIVTIEPIYSQEYPALLIDCEDGKYTHRILLDRHNPNNFRYEKTVSTDFGSASLKSYNSRTENNYDINKFVSNLIENSVGKVVNDEKWDRVLDRERERAFLL